MALEAGTRLGPYEILSPLGAGRMGEVYRAELVGMCFGVRDVLVVKEAVRDPRLSMRYGLPTS